MRQKRTRVLIILAFVVVALVGVLLFHFNLLKRLESSLIADVTISTDVPISVELFFASDAEHAKLITDVSSIDITVPGEYRLKVRLLSLLEKDVLLHIADTKGPLATVVPQEYYLGFEPLAESTLTDISDISLPCEIYYLDENELPSEGGEYYVPVVLKDVCGNESIYHVPFSVTDDHTPPTISGVEDKEYFIGDTILYRENIEVIDDYDSEPELTIDTSQVSPSQEGVYTVYYHATDDAGNESTVQSLITMRIKPEGYVEPDIVYGLAEEVLDEITTEGMSDIEIAFRIHHWARYTIHYVGYSIKTDWTACAYEGFTTLRGDCYTYYCCCKALLDVAGIENVLVIRDPALNLPHYWNLEYLDGQWYHSDSSPSNRHYGFQFMMIDSELDALNEFIDDELPDRATESVQYRLDFTNLTIEEEE